MPSKLAQQTFYGKEGIELLSDMGHEAFMFSEGPIKDATNEVTKRWKGIYTWDTQKNDTALVAIVSHKYQLIEHDEVIGAVIENLHKIYDMGYHMDMGYYLGDYGTKMFIRFKSNETINIDGELIQKGFEVCNSTDGSMNLRLNINLLRLVCSNGMVLQGFGDIAKLRHIGSKANVSDFIKQGIAQLNNIYESIELLIKQARKHTLTTQEVKDYLEKLNLPQYMIGPLTDKIETIEKEELTPNEVSVWDFYNDITEQITHTDKTFSKQRYNDLQRQAERVLVIPTS